MERALRGILLDLDETLYSREEAFWEWIDVETRAAPAARELDRNRVAELDQRGRGDKQALLEYLDSVLDWQQTQQERKRRFRSGISQAVRLAQGVKESLTRIGLQFKLGLISNGTGATQRAKLEALGVQSLFDPIVISDEVGLRKPDVRIFELAITNWRIAPGDVLFVGDDPVLDISGAGAAGMRVLRTGHASGIPSIRELESWLIEKQHMKRCDSAEL
jgi:putative hydrolase of the HAD superfamily